MPEATSCTVWFTGLSGSGKTTCSREVAALLRARGLRVEVPYGDVIRTNLGKVRDRCRNRRPNP